jgi:cation:H+ antiporter
MTIGIFTTWLQFAVCVGAIGLAGPVMVRSGQAIATITGISTSWIGLILLATATSLPELFTGLSAVTIASAPNIAMGDALGSCIFNLVMLALLDALSQEEPVWRRSDQGHILTAAFGIILISFTGALVLLTQAGLGLDFHIGHVSLYSPLLLLLYLVAMRAAFFHEHRGRDRVIQPDEVAGSAGTSMTSAILHYLAAAGVVAAVGAYLPFVGLDLAEVMGWRTSFVGTLFIAAATSVPELVVTVSALRMGSVDMAIGNLLGSNLFAILVIVLDDFAYLEGSFFSSVSQAHAVTAFAVAIMTGLCIVGLLYRPGNRFFGRAGWIGLGLLGVYLLASYAIYLHGP